MTKKLGLWLLTAAVLMSGPLQGVQAESGRSPEGTDVSMIWVNPMYEGILGPDSGTEGKVQKESRAGSGTAAYLSPKKASAYVRGQMVKRNSTITVGVQSSTGDIAGLISSVYKNAMATVKSTPGQEGDYILYHVAECRAGFIYYPGGQYTITYEIHYLTTKAQESKVTARVSSVLSSLGVKNMTAYGKIKTIYDYICKNVSYDYEGMNDSSLGKFTAYNALFRKKAVCQGYASLLYRMMREAGITARILSGTSNSEPHAWNIVKLGSSYYNMDSTWDAGKKTYAFFLKNKKGFPDHTRDPEYQTASFQKDCPMSSKSYKGGGTPIYSLARAKVSGVKNKVYNGKKRTQKAALKLGGVRLKKDRDYRVSYKNNVKAGTATIIFTGKDNYSGKIKKNFRIIRKK